MALSVSVITVVLNRKETIESCLRSVQEQTHREIEHVVIDGSSTDGTLEILRERQDEIDVLISEADDGPYDALNKGLSMASGDLVGVLHSDDRFASPSTLENVVDHIDCEDTDSVYGDLVYRTGIGGRVVRHWIAGEYKRARFRLGWMPPHPAFFMRRALVKAYGGYRSEFGTAADYELLLRYLYKYRISTSYLNETLVDMGLGGLSGRSLLSRVRANAMDRQAWIENGLNPACLFRALKPARKILQYRFL